jgi:penicillin-binding protein 2
VQVHYRWLQREADSAWLRQQIRQVLSREERKDDALVQSTTETILGRREAMLQSLSDLVGLSLTELTARCRRIEQRVQRISDVINARLVASDPDEEEEEDRDEGSGFLLDWATTVREALTTPPQRELPARLVAKEEESWHTVLEDVPFEVAATINEFPERFPGVRIIAETQRTYPAQQLAAHLVGARTKVSDLKSQSSSVETSNDSNSFKGRFGIEKSCNDRLSGFPGLRRIVRDHRQRVVSSEIVRKPVSGRDVMLTIDSELQKLAELLLAESLGDAERTLLSVPSSDSVPSVAESEILTPPEPEHVPAGGSVVVMEVDTGRVVAAASAPGFDLSMFIGGTEAQWDAVNGDVRQPFVSRFISMALPPGSTFKIVTAIAGMQSGELLPDEPFECRGYLSDPDEHRCLIYRLYGRGHHTVNLRTALAQSCNVYFFDAARRMGIVPLAEWTDTLGFGHQTGIDLPFEKPGSVPAGDSRNAATASPASLRRFEREALGLAIGQSRLTVTPMQMARLLACVANGGWLVTPHVLSDEGTAHHTSEIDDSPFRAERHRVPGLKHETLVAIREGLVATIEDPAGTGYKTIRVPGVTMAGKTGTAESAPGKPDHAWFAGFVPAKKPRYAVVVVLEHGGSGAKAAGPIVRELVKSLSKRGLLSEALTNAL